MLQVKTAAIVTIRKLLKERGAKAERRVCERLAPETREIFERIHTVAWITNEQDAEILTAAAQVLFPDQPGAIQELGRAVVKIQFTGPFKSTLVVPTMTYVFRRLFQEMRAKQEESQDRLQGFSPITFILERVPNLWRLFYDEGMAKVQDISPNHATLVVEDLSGMHPISRDYATGFIIGLLELAGAKNPRVEHRDQNPRAWRWEMHWE